MSECKPAVLALGPLPPPYHGVATFLRDLLAHSAEAPVGFAHLDTSDHRDAGNLGRWDACNLRLGFSHLAELAGRGLRRRVDALYLPLSQSIPAAMRDALFILQARMLGARVVIHLHGGYFRTLYDRDGGAAFRALLRPALRQVSAAVVLGESLRPVFDGLIEPGRVHVVENGVSDSGAWAARQAGTAPPEKPTILYMSTLTRTKGLLELLAAFARLRRKLPQAGLRVAGAWAEEDLRVEALAFIEREQMAGAVDFVGNVSGAGKAAFLAGGQVFCLPTRYPYEGQPLVILEALAAGLPVCSTAQGVIADTVVDGQTGRVLPVGSAPEAFAGALEQMFSDPEKLGEFSRNARQRYLERYTLGACHRRLYAVFEEVFAKS